tara:strand:- start:1241 stop:2308 length:1068 start_codon:yes stop_codon:yes gene_type:complete
MNLGEIEKRVTSSAVNKQLKKTFNHEIDFTKLTPKLALDVLESTRNDIKQIKLNGTDASTSQKYLNAVMTVEALEKWITEQKIVKEWDMPGRKMQVTDADKNANTPAWKRYKAGDPRYEYKGDAKESIKEAFGDNATAKQALRMLVGSQNYAKALRAMQMAREGKSVPANFMGGLFPLLDLLENVMSASLSNVHIMKQLDKRSQRMLKIKEGVLKEGEMESAELVLAAKDMVDQLQKMQEQLGELQNENLPPLVDAIRDEMGQDKADAFSNAAKGTIETCLSSVEGARAGMDSAARLLTGQETGIDLGADPEGADAMEPAGDIDIDSVDADMPTMDLDSPEGGTEGEPGLDREER